MANRAYHRDVKDAPGALNAWNVRIEACMGEVDSERLAGMVVGRTNSPEVEKHHVLRVISGAVFELNAKGDRSPLPCRATV
jgi:hypothetical protein